MITKVRSLRYNAWKKEFGHCFSADVTVGTNGPQGGDAGHGCETYLDVSHSGAAVEYKIHERDNGITIKLGGDDELCTLIEILEWALEVLRIQSETKE